MRREDRALAPDDAGRLLQSAEYGVLSTVDDQGQPYGVPLNYVYSNGCLYFHCALQGHKLDNLLANRRVSFCVVGATRLLPDQFSTEYESVIVCGEAGEVHGAERYQALTSLVEKYAPGFVRQGEQYIERHDCRTKVVRIVIETMTGKAKRGKKL